MSVLPRASPPEADLSRSLRCESWAPGQGAVKFLHRRVTCSQHPTPALPPAPPLPVNSTVWGETALAPCNYHALYQLPLVSICQWSLIKSIFTRVIQRWWLFYSGTSSALRTWHSAFHDKQETIFFSIYVSVIDTGRWFPPFLWSTIHYCPSLFGC